MILAMFATGVLWAQASDTSMSSRVEHFFNPVRPGDQVTITIRATRPGGLQKLNGFFDRSQYLSAAGKNEHMISLTFEPTGAPDEFRTEFAVPRASGGKPLLKGRYRLNVTGGLDGSGNGFRHRYITAGSLDFDPAAGEPWEGRMATRYVLGLASAKNKHQLLTN